MQKLPKELNGNIKGVTVSCQKECLTVWIETPLTVDKEVRNDYSIRSERC